MQASSIIEMNRFYKVVIYYWLFFSASFLHGQALNEVRFVDMDFGVEEIERWEFVFGHGVSAADFDNDGDIDFFVSTVDGVRDRLYVNDGVGSFSEEAGSYGLASVSGSTTAIWFDYNADSLLDLLVAGDCYNDDCSSLGKIRLYKQEESGFFVESTEGSGFGIDDYYNNVNRKIGGMVAGDIDGNGYLDVIVTFWKGPLLIYMNDEDGTFTESSTQLNVNSPQLAHWQPLIHDFNRDGLQDIYVNVDFRPNRLWIANGNGTFRESAGEYGLATSFNEMGLAIGDYDNDNDFDFFLTNIFNYPGNNILYTREQIGNQVLFVDKSEEMSVANAGWGWGTTFFDANNDGWLDLAACNGYLDIVDSSRFWLNDEGGGFIDYSSESSFNDALTSTTLISADLDRDGDLDLIQSVKGDETGFGSVLEPVRHYDNTSSTGGFFVIKPRMKGPNTFAIGAIVKIRTGSLSQMRLITAGTSFYGQEPAEAFFGVGDSRVVDEVSIEWPDGLRSRWFNLSANKMHVLVNDDSTSVIDTLRRETEVSNSGGIVLGTNDLHYEKSIVVFPNPSTGEFQVMLRNDLYGFLEVQVINSTGMIVASRAFTKDFFKFVSNSFSIEGKGLFYVRISVDNQVFYKKVIVF